MRVSLGNDPVTDAYKVRSKTFRGSARAADEALRDLIDQQDPSRSDGAGATFAQLLDQWLEECERLDLSPTTLRVYRALIKTPTIWPRLGKVLLSFLSAKNLDELYGTMKDAGTSPKTIWKDHALIVAALHHGVRWGWVRYKMSSTTDSTAFTDLERQLASPEGDTRASEPVRKVPRRRSAECQLCIDRLSTLVEIDICKCGCLHLHKFHLEEDLP